MVTIFSFPLCFPFPEEVLSSILLRTSNTESPSSRGWVMPFFVSSMALLLFLFLGFVIGVTIWCHRQSRTNESRETAEVPECLEEDQSTLSKILMILYFPLITFVFSLPKCYLRLPLL